MPQLEVTGVLVSALPLLGGKVPALLVPSIAGPGTVSCDDAVVAFASVIQQQLALILIYCAHGVVMEIQFLVQ